MTITADGWVTIAHPRDRVPPGNTVQAGSLRALAAAVFDAIGDLAGVASVGAAMPRHLRYDVRVLVDRRIVWPWVRWRLARAAELAARLTIPAGFDVGVRVLERWRCRSA